MNSPLRIVLIAPSGVAAAAVVARQTGHDLCESAPAGRLDLVHAFGPLRGLPPALGWRFFSCLPLVWTPPGPGEPLPWWSHRVARIVVTTQEQARAWARHVPLGRICVANDAESLAVVYREVAVAAGRALRTTSGRSSARGAR